MKAGFYHWRVGDRNRPIFSIKIYADEISTQAPLIGSGQEKLLCSLNADLVCIHYAFSNPRHILLYIIGQFQYFSLLEFRQITRRRSLLSWT
jgi:hypothetical protein